MILNIAFLSNYHVELSISICNLNLQLKNENKPDSDRL